MRVQASPEMRPKRGLESLLRKHGYHLDERPDHREWFKGTPSYHLQVRLDQNNPTGFNGFELTITTYLRWDPDPGGWSGC